MPTAVHNLLLWAAPSWVQHQGLPTAPGTAACPGLQTGPYSQGTESSTNPSDRQVSGTHHMLHGGPSPEDDGVCEVRPLCTGRDGVGVSQSWPHTMWFLPSGNRGPSSLQPGASLPLYLAYPHCRAPCKINPSPGFKLPATQSAMRAPAEPCEASGKYWHDVTAAGI